MQDNPKISNVTHSGQFGHPERKTNRVTSIQKRASESITAGFLNNSDTAKRWLEDLPKAKTSEFLKASEIALKYH